MTKLGGYMMFFGIGSIVLGYFNMQFFLLSWIDNWGVSTGWVIKIGLIVVGVALLLFSPKGDATTT